MAARANSRPVPLVLLSIRTSRRVLMLLPRSSTEHSSPLRMTGGSKADVTSRVLPRRDLQPIVVLKAATLATDYSPATIGRYRWFPDNGSHHPVREPPRVCQDVAWPTSSLPGTQPRWCHP